MSNQYLKLRRSSVPGKIPETGSLDFGELALNTADGLVFMKKSGSAGEEVISIGSNVSGTSVFLKNKTSTSSINVITVNQSVFNPSNLLVLSSSAFEVETDADYYVLGNLTNSGSISVTGSLKIGGVLYNGGIITGTGIIE